MDRTVFEVLSADIAVSTDGVLACFTRDPWFADGLTSGFSIGLVTLASSPVLWFANGPVLWFDNSHKLLARSFCPRQLFRAHGVPSEVPATPLSLSRTVSLSVPPFLQLLV